MDRCAEPVIETHDLCRYYYLGDETVRALDKVDLAVTAGTFFGISGASGSGKSTLLYLLGGMDYPTAGRVRVMGQEIVGLDENQLAVFRRHTVGFVYQSFHLIPSMTALENVELPLLLAGVSRGARRRRAAQLLDLVGLGPRSKHRPAQMSGGQQQRVAVARALTNSPPILLADEPTGNLDSSTGQEIIHMFRELCRQERLTIVMVSHDRAAIEACDVYVRMQDGRIVSTHTPSVVNGGRSGDALPGGAR